jgi:hypothetical protein
MNGNFARVSLCSGTTSVETGSYFSKSIAGFDCAKAVAANVNKAMRARRRRIR